MAALKALGAFLALIIIVVVVWYFVYGFKGVGGGIVPTTSSTTTTASGNQTGGTTTTTIYLAGPCQTFSLITNTVNTLSEAKCSWTGGALGLWVESGNVKSTTISITGQDGVTYFNNSVSYQCITFFKNITLPAQNYIVAIKSGISTQNQSAACPYSGIVINSTLSPPQSATYKYVYNGNFSNGEYTGWNVTGKGFGTAPLNITYANSNAISPCYLGTKWSNYHGAFIATTYSCGTEVAPGNITSSTFIASKSFLNFKLISPQNNFMYVEILYNNTPYIIAHYNTFNVSSGGNASATFRNASIPLVTVINKPIRIKVVANTQTAQSFLAVGDFALSTNPNQDKGILQNITFTH